MAYALYILILFGVDLAVFSAGGGSPLYLWSKQVSERNVIVFIIDLSVVFYEFKAIL